MLRVIGICGRILMWIRVVLIGSATEKERIVIEHIICFNLANVNSRKDHTFAFNINNTIWIKFH